MTLIPLRYEQLYLQQHYKRYSLEKLCVKLGVGTAQLALWMAYMGLSKDRAVLTPEQQQTIRDELENYTHQGLADKIGVSVGMVRRYCYKEGLRKRK
jgi:hypothetical protein